MWNREGILKQISTGGSERVDRRSFLKQFLAGAAGVAMAPNMVLSNRDELTISILHTNDTHARIDPFPENHPQYANLGGFARRARLVKQIRKTDKHVLLLDSGDVFQGTPYFNLYDGELDYKLMSQLGYDASTLGNHEFDNGVDGWLDVVKHANFPVLNSNYDIDRTDAQEAVSNILIKEFEGVKVGIFGLGVDFDGLVLKELHKGFRYFDPVGVARGVTRNMKRYMDCSVVICLSHLGYRYEDDRISDQKLAREVPDIDLILGGHTHTFLDQPEEVRHSDGSITRINQVGFAGIQLGYLKLRLNNLREITMVNHHSVTVDRKYA